MQKNTCCFWGHRKIEETEELLSSLENIIKNLILYEDVDTFLFGSKSQFNSLAYRITSRLKRNHPNIKRVYVRSHFEHISDEYKKHLLCNYEKTYFPEKLHNSGKAAYVERNFEMIDKSSFCIIYFDENYSPTGKTSKSGTKIAYDYALKKGRVIFNVFNSI